jgi:hypothetical protein
VAIDYGWVKEGSRLHRPFQINAAAAVTGSPRCSTRVASLRTIRSCLSRSCAGFRPPSSKWSRLPTSSIERLSPDGGRHRKELGEPRASIVPLSGVSGELIVTVAWDISWYQYRVSPESAQASAWPSGARDGPARRGYQNWNASIEQDGRLVPKISPL